MGSRLDTEACRQIGQFDGWMTKTSRLHGGRAGGGRESGVCPNGGVQETGHTEDAHLANSSSAFQPRRKVTTQVIALEVT